MKKVLCFLADGFEDIEAIATIDLLRRANIHVTTCGLQKKSVLSSANITVEADTIISELAEDFDLLFLPGGKGVPNLEQDSSVIKIIQEFAQQNKWIAAICAAPSILGKLSLLDNEHFTCYPSFEKYMPKGIYLDQQVVVSNKFITGNGIGGVFPFGLTIIEILSSDVIKTKVQESTLIQTN